MSKNRAINLGIGLVIGSLAGVAVALLAAPQSGVQTRAFLREKGEEIVEKTNHTLTDGRERAKTLVSEAREKVSNFGAMIRSRVNALPQEVREIPAD